MAHFALIDATCTVVKVLSGSDNDDGKELEICARTGMTYRQCSYNTRSGIYYENGVPAEDQSKAFRKNFPGPAWRYDYDRDAFIPPKMYPSWVLNEETCQWECPVERPDNEQAWDWDETNKRWFLPTE